MTERTPKVRKYTMESAAVVESLLSASERRLTPEETTAVRLALNALQTLARAEERDDYASFVHGAKRSKRPALQTSMMYTDIAMQCPECGEWINRQKQAKYTDNELLHCMRMALDCSKGLDMECDGCMVAQVPHNPSLDCDAAMLEVAIRQMMM